MKSGGMRNRQKKQRAQEEFAAVPSCPMLYALIPPEIQPLQGRPTQSRVRPESAPTHGGGPLRQSNGGSPGENSGDVSPVSASSTPGKSTPPPADPMHIRARSWDVNDLSRQMLVEQGQPWLCKVPFADVSLAVECVVHSAMVTLEATWALDDVPLPPSLAGQLDCLFVMPLKDQASVCGVEVLPGEKRLLATAVVPQEEAEMAYRHMSFLQSQQQQQQQHQQLSLKGSQSQEVGSAKHSGRGGERGGGGGPKGVQMQRSTSAPLRQRLFPRSLTSNYSQSHASGNHNGTSHNSDRSGGSGGGGAGVALRTLSTHRRLFTQMVSSPRGDTHRERGSHKGKGRERGGEGGAERARNSFKDRPSLLPAIPSTTSEDEGSERSWGVPHSLGSGSHPRGGGARGSAGAGGAHRRSSSNASDRMGKGDTDRDRGRDRDRDRGREREGEEEEEEEEVEEEEEGEGEAWASVREALGESPLLGRRVDPHVAAVLLQDPDGYSSCLFRLRIPKVRVGSKVQIHITYLEAMRLQGGAFLEMSVPLTIPWDCIPADTPLHEAVRVSCMIHSGLQQPIKIGDFNHPMKVLFVELGRATFVGYPDPSDPDSWPNTSFLASFQVVNEEAHGGVLVQAPVAAAQDSRPTFCLATCLPDAPLPAKPPFRRAIIFVIDSSSSLRSKQMDDARRAIASALKRLDGRDAFLLIAFDYELLTSSDDLELATPEAVKKACKFILRAHDCHSPGNIFTPLDLALHMMKAFLHGRRTSRSDDGEDGRGTGPAMNVVPQIVLITDGSVPDERRICQHVQTLLLDWGRNPPRIFTFGIGAQCNFYFLKWLASVSRGTTEMAYNRDEVRSRLEKLLQSISRPMVTNVTVKDLPPGCELYPYPIPDLYLGVPVVVTGKLGGADEEGEGEGGGGGEDTGLPSHLSLRGTHEDGSTWRCKAPLADANNIPLNSVGIKEQLDILTADAWLHQDASMEETVNSLSMAASVPTEHTSMVYFQTRNSLFQDFQRHRVQGTRGDIRTYTDPLNPFLLQVPGLARGFGRSSASAQGMKEDEGDYNGSTNGTSGGSTGVSAGTGDGAPRVLQSRQSIREKLANGGLSFKREAQEEEGEGGEEDGEDEQEKGREEEERGGGGGRRERRPIPKQTSTERLAAAITRPGGLISNALTCYFPKNLKQFHD